MALVKVRQKNVKKKELAGDENLSRYQMILMSNNTVKEPVERRLFQSRYHRILMSLEIYQVTARGQFPQPHFY